MSKTAIVTGASRGIGYEICKQLAAKGHQVIAVARSVNLLKELENHAPDFITAVPTDLTETDDVQQLAKHIKENQAGVDILINNAGALINKPFTELTLEDWRSQLESNLISAVHVTKSLLPQFQEGAHIVNISSMGGFQGSAKFPGLTAYSVAKGALSILTECLAAELGDLDIKANALCLGAVQTEMLEEAFPGIEAPIEADKMGSYITDFALNGSTYYNGKILPVALNDPE
jgi:NAD(P)-dependent dehydrogenase (short-subunit alcohol dehydrogenase family)